jgi:hypothetical protein
MVVDAYRVLVGKCKANLLLGRCTWQDSIKMVLKEIGWEHVD